MTDKPTLTDVVVWFDTAARRVGPNAAEHAYAATVREAIALLESCADTVRSSSGGRCSADGHLSCPDCKILADIRRVLGAKQ